ncbi:MAG: hypothetical protein JWQ62_2937 [Lacunisphaera sp.]|nr:hypothetical protein [Lacunisphaera sp.]
MVVAVCRCHKELNPLGKAFTSAGLREFNLGTTATRFSADFWAIKARIISGELSSPAVLVLCAVLLLLAGRARWRETVACVGWFGTVLVLFPVLYTYHSYYYMANAALLLVAMGFVLVALAESAAPRWLVAVAACLVLGGQAARYVEQYYPGQRFVTPGGDGLTTSLRALTNPRDVIVVLGQDWNSMTPYYAQRRGVMIRDDIAPDAGRVEQALAQLDGEKIGALVIVGHPDGAQWLIDRTVVRGLGREPVYVWRDAQVYLPAARRAELIEALLETPFHEVRLAPGVEIPHADLKNRWVEMATVRRWERQAFMAIQPAPVRFFSTFGPGMDGSSGQPMYGAHPVTRLVFALPAGQHVLRSSLQMPFDAYRLDLPDAETTDGVEVSLFELGPDGWRHQLATRYFDPRHRPEDRGRMLPLEFSFELLTAGEVELFFGPGPAGRDMRDWIQLGPLKID